MSEQSNYPTSNFGSEYFNLNIWRTFIQPVGTDTVAISGADVLNGWPCSEVIIKNSTSEVVYIWDNDYKNTNHENFYWQLKANEEVTIRGITNVNQVSAAAATGQHHDLFIRAQYFSSNPIR